jgi:hypothetical protein
MVNIAIYLSKILEAFDCDLARKLASTSIGDV